jgi:hypothetical protein
LTVRLHSYFRNFPGDQELVEEEAEQTNPAAAYDDGVENYKFVAFAFAADS